MMISNQSTEVVITDKVNSYMYIIQLLTIEALDMM